MKSFGNSILGICLGVAVLVLTFRGCPLKPARTALETVTKPNIVRK